MSVKDVNTGGVNQASKGLSPVRVFTVNTLPGVQSAQSTTDTVSVESPATDRPSVAQQRLRGKINRAIEATNVASGAVEDLGRILGGIEGIVEQVSSNDLPPQRVAILEKEANNLRDQLVRTADVSTSDGVKPLAGDSIRLELEETLGKTLEIILPDSARSAFGIGDVSLSPKDFILDTVARVEEARRSIEQLRGQLDSGISSIRTAVSVLEVASQNVEASQTTVRDVDDALDLARLAKGGIQEDPKDAIGSVGDLTKSAPELLKT